MTNNTKTNDNTGSFEQLDANGWSDGFYETTAGTWTGEPLIREPQGEYELRLELDDNQSENMD